MWIQTISRRDLVELISPRGSIDMSKAVELVVPTFDMLSSERMAAVWPMRPAEFGRLPTAIIVKEGGQLDTLAWLATYVRDFRPFTAFCRVIEKSTAERFISGPPSPSLNGAEGVFTGLILGESLAHFRGRVAVFDLPSTAYSATLSHAISRTFALTGGRVFIDLIARNWLRAREISGQSDSTVQAGAILSVWSVILGMPFHQAKGRGLFDSSNLLTAAWQDLSSTGEIREKMWVELTDGMPDLLKMREMASLPREHRVEIIDHALHMLVTHKEPDDRSAFLAGYFTSLLAPGTVDHAEVLIPVAPIMPTAYMWYGAFAGLNVRSEGLPTGNPLARRIVRDLTLPDRLAERPRCDVALEEMGMLLPGKKFLRLTAKLGRLDIDLFPGVTTSVRWPPHDNPNEEEISRARHQETQRLFAEIDELSIRNRYLMDRLRDTVLRENTRQSAKRKKGR